MLFFLGVSSGVLCVIFGIYEKLVDSVLGIFKDFKKNFFFLLPIAIGVFIGVVLFGNILNYLFSSFEQHTKVLFMGLILGSIPSLFKTANSPKGFRLHFLIYTLATFLVSILLVLFENGGTTHINNMYLKNNFIFYIISGFFMSAGVVIPGVSSSVILMLLGVYYVYLESVSILNLTVLIPMGIGLVLGGLLFLVIIKILMNKYYSQTFYAIIGFVLGSCFILLPSNNFSLAYIPLFIIGFLIALKFEN